MYARVTTMPIQLDRIDEAIEIYKKSVIPAAKKQKGFRGVCLLGDIPSGKCIAVTFWNSKKDAEANEENLYYQEQLAKFVDMFAGPPIKEGYDVIVHVLLEKAVPRGVKKR